MFSEDELIKKIKEKNLKKESSKEFSKKPSRIPLKNPSEKHEKRIDCWIEFSNEK